MSEGEKKSQPPITAAPNRPANQSLSMAPSLARGRSLGCASTKAPDGCAAHPGMQKSNARRLLAPDQFAGLRAGPVEFEGPLASCLPDQVSQLGQDELFHGQTDGGPGAGHGEEDDAADQPPD